MNTIISYVNCPYFSDLKNQLQQTFSTPIQPLELSGNMPIYPKQTLFIIEANRLNPAYAHYDSLHQFLTQNQPITVALSKKPAVTELQYAIQAGASAYLCCNPIEQVVTAVISLLNNITLFDPTTLLQLATHGHAPPTIDHTTLTPTESRILRQLANGSNNKTISETVGISINTVKTHLRHIFKKLNVADRTEAAVWVWKNHSNTDHPKG